MANEKRKRQNFISGLVEDNPLTDTATKLTSAGLADITGGVGSTEHMAITLDYEGIDGDPEIAYITSLTAGAGATGLTGLLRGQEGTTARQHDLNTPWRHGPTLVDFTRLSKRLSLTNKDGWSAIDTFEQWGTEEVALAQTLVPKYSTVAVWLSGYVESDGGTASLDIGVEISLDGGSTWTMGPTTARRDNQGASTTNRDNINCHHLRSGQITGEIQARAMGKVATSTAGRDLKSGSLLMVVTPYLVGED